MVVFLAVEYLHFAKKFRYSWVIVLCCFDGGVHVMSCCRWWGIFCCAAAGMLMTAREFPCRRRRANFASCIVGALYCLCWQGIVLLSIMEELSTWGMGCDDERRDIMLLRSTSGAFVRLCHQGELTHPGKNILHIDWKSYFCSIFIAIWEWHINIYCNI